MIKKLFSFDYTKKTNKMPNWKDLLGTGKVVVFSKSYCPYCTEVANVLDTIEVEYTKIEVDLEWSPHDEQKLKTESKQNTFPNVFVGNTHIGGCDSTKAKINNGSLFNILDTEGVAYNK